MRIPALVLTAAAGLSAAEPLFVRLWPGGAPGWEGRPDQESVEKGTDGQRRASNVSNPSMLVFLPPAATATGGAVIICPGGGYVRLSIDKEGEDVARWLNTFGVAGIVLRYRLMPSSDPPPATSEERTRKREVHARVALEDGKRAVRLVRHHAKEWRIDLGRVALMGFSAGGHLAANVGMNFDMGHADASDRIDRLSSRPDALIPIYAGRFENPAFSTDAPPAFIMHAHDDPTVPSEYSAQLYQAIKKARVPAELHIFARGGHPFGINKTGHAVDQWPERLREWLEIQGWLRK